ncbi:hypothetical protein JTE90_029529 [Oedothorax gibbosus]|uniref:Homeobox domain-containing protein n=1 Tax=Oedothorax gibbosus TaxID=931172 RepID=A0AAV6VAU2_9ARAC|nr:hypothetical protein JTE90_029529 [Oedothorax gibbosus]
MTFEHPKFQYFSVKGDYKNSYSYAFSGAGIPCPPAYTYAASSVAKPVPRPFLDSHLHSLVACRNPYFTGPTSGLPGVSLGFHHPSSLGGGTFPLPATFPWAAAARGKPRRGMMRRAVFSDAQRQGLEKRFQIQKYISKPDRKKLAEKLGLKDSQVCMECVDDGMMVRVKNRGKKRKAEHVGYCQNRKHLRDILDV